MNSEALKAEVERLELDNHLLQSRNEEIAAKSAKQASQLRSMERKNLSLKTQILNRTEKLSKSDHDIEILQVRNESLRRECENLSAAFSSAESQYNESQQDLEIAESHVEHLKIENERLKAENERLTAQVGQPKPTPYQPKMDALRNHTYFLKRLCEELEFDVNELQAVIGKS